jgi:predicted dehydrogenase
LISPDAASNAMLRFGLIGLGNIGKVYVADFDAGKVRGGCLTAVCSRRPPAIQLPNGVRYFANADALLDSGEVDAVIVATPHLSHRELGEKVLKRGLHLMMEKPLTASKLEGERILEVPLRDGQQFGIMMNLRMHPQMQRIRSMMEDNELGELQRVQWIISNWFRSEAYYASSEWRASWKGEGGGVLINQALHNLDLLQWLCGMPNSLQAFCRFGQDHDIEVEDRVTSYLEFPNGASGVFSTSTGEAPGVNRLEIAGTKGLIVLEDDALTVQRNDVDSKDYLQTTDDAFGSPGTSQEVFPAGEENPAHAGILSNFVDAIEGKAALFAAASGGLAAVELANAMVYSAWTNAPVKLPLDSAAYEAALMKKIATSPPRSRKVREVTVDMDQSFS